MDTHTILKAPRQLRTTISLPASKSISNRALIINALSHSTVTPENVSDCDDTRVMLQALRHNPDVVDIQAAGTAMRFLSAYYATRPGSRVMTGTERMKHRPIGVLVDALRTLGAQVDYVGEAGFPPLRITGGNHEGGELTLPGNVSSQYISALLMIAPVLRRGLTLHLTGTVVSIPYIYMTLQMMREFGARVAWDEQQATIRVEPGCYRERNYRIENDWSAASYWYEMVALSADARAEVRLPGLFRESTQGDAHVQQLFEPLGVTTGWDGDTVVLRKSGALTEGFVSFDLQNQPDLAQTLVVTCALQERPFRFTGLQSLKIKETDRMAALCQELHKLGYVLREESDSVLSWDGERCPAEDRPVIRTYEDHRMAMSFAPVALCRPGVRIAHPEVVSKSYPAFWNDLEQAGFRCTQK